MKKYILDFRVVENTKLHDNYALLKLKPDNNEPLPDMLPGQFVEVRVDRSRLLENKQVACCRKAYNYSTKNPHLRLAKSPDTERSVPGVFFFVLGK